MKQLKYNISVNFYGIGRFLCKDAPSIKLKFYENIATVYDSHFLTTKHQLRIARVIWNFASGISSRSKNCHFVNYWDILKN